MTGRRFRADERSVSVTVNYALNLLVAGLLVGGVLAATGGMVEDRRESAVRSELSVVGERLATDLNAADRLAVVGTDDSAADPAVAVSVTLPERLAATRYDVTVQTAPTPRLVLQSRDPEVTVTVGFHHETAFAESEITVRGGDLRIVLNDEGKLEVREA